ncbi:MAG: hypothetical protein KME08_02285 [Aphanothece sp. CMT-3BRIN-NPC111]|jgi:lysophospholipase L1-like esterase|nr:hypothetical protein [Aphanothece sp. CMT-3BRIN-NPC111]
MLPVILLLLGYNNLPASSQASDATKLSLPSNRLPQIPDLGPSQQMSYEQWIALLGREAKVAALKQPQNLTVLAGDSLSQSFPITLLPPKRTWLNQGISGETSAGLLRRLHLFDQTQPEVIFVMIGINDLLRGMKGETVLANQQQIIRYLRQVHPQSQIVIQSILPHVGTSSTKESRDRLSKIPNSSIREMNRKISAIAAQEGALYLDLQPLFTDAQGNLRPELSTDGLHLSRQGYLIWGAALQSFSPLKLQ